MTAKEYLNQLMKLSIQINIKKKQQKKLRESIDYLHGIDYAKDRVQTSPDDKMSANIALLVDLENELERDIVVYAGMYHDCVSKIGALSKKEYIQILHDRYIDRKKFEEISCHIGYSYYRTCRMHGEALDEFERKFMRK